MNKHYLVALDQGTTSSRAIVFNKEGGVVASAQMEFRQIYPKAAWVEHDPDDILFTQIESLRMAVRKAGIYPSEIAAIGIANQRETSIVWDRESGRPVYNAIVWQCRRTAQYVERLKKEGHEERIKQKTGLVPDAYFSGTKLAWILDTLRLRERAKRGELCFGTVDSFLAWNMVKGRPHVSDITNASRTMLFNIETQDWDDELLALMDIPRRILPKLVDTSQVIGELKEDILGVPIPVAALVGDQHAALFGQACVEEGMAKNTYGTGCFMLMNTGDEIKRSNYGLLTTVAWRIGGKISYALEGSVFMGGATIQWLRDELKVLTSASESEALALSVPDSGGAYLVPAFTGLGAPHWDMYARGTLLGMSRGTGRAHIVRAALEAIAYQSQDLFAAMAKDANSEPKDLRVDGGASANHFLMQFQSDILAIPIRRPKVLETTALGAAALAGLAVGIYQNEQSISSLWEEDKSFYPVMDNTDREKALAGWRKALDAARYWAKL